ncbi:hypothetical protein [Spiroplasma attinicola]|uniref:hypothetical protein n=1 Tax=Spiroplasma attinicola TaxID=2904537 RepID=UPI002022A227|nr:MULTISPECIES: hypothetical protein [unclassified Spiroplasma]MCL8209588.1 hypothetical protein [Spiroplasma sp. JKS002670]MCL8210401.1 hypothetical protein [Spiroplasma sp. JKS002671]
MDKKNQEDNEKEIELKSNYFYLLKRNYDKDKTGRAAVIINVTKNEAVVWSGTSQYDEENKYEEPLAIQLNKLTYFYGNDIEKVKTSELVEKWINTRTKQTVTLTEAQQEAFAKKFISITKFENPYIKIEKLEKTIQDNVNKINEINFKNYQISEENKLLKQETKNKIDQETTINISFNEYINLKNNRDFKQAENKLLKQKLAVKEKIKQNSNKESEIEKE